MEVAGSLLPQQCQQSLPVLTLCHHSPSHGKCMLARAKARGEIRHYRASNIHNLLWQKRTHFSLSSPFEKGIISGQARFFLCMCKKPGPTMLVLRSCITTVCVGVRADGPLQGVTWPAQLAPPHGKILGLTKKVLN